ncbi:MAG TPA: hypothetical protein VFT22_11090 [Kofleriaceae bacterium]|nr:hypothetical protein [Kofleriaceae bacterium]
MATTSAIEATSSRETDEVTAARVLAHACDQLAQILDDYGRRVLARVAKRGAPGRRDPGS